MNMQDSFSQLNWLAIIIAAISTFLIGGFWYSLFEKQWMAANGFTREFLEAKKITRCFRLVLHSFHSSWRSTLHCLLGKEVASFGGMAGFMTGFGWIFFAIGIIALFEKKPLSYVLS